MWRNANIVLGVVCGVAGYALPTLFFAWGYAFGPEWIRFGLVAFLIVAGLIGGSLGRRVSPPTRRSIDEQIGTTIYIAVVAAFSGALVGLVPLGLVLFF